MSAKTSTPIPPVGGSHRSTAGDDPDAGARPWIPRAAEVARARRDAPSTVDLAEDVAALRAIVRGLLAEREVLESRIATLERAMSEPSLTAAAVPEGPVANADRLFVRMRRLIPLRLRKAIVEAYRRWSR